MTEQSIVEKSSVYISANHEDFEYLENELYKLAAQGF